MKTDFEKNYQLMPQASMTLDVNLVFKNANIAYCQAVRRTPDQLIGRHVFDAFPDAEEARRPVLAAFEKTLTGEITKKACMPYKLYLPNGEVQDRLWDAENHPLYSDTGEVIGIVQYCEDVTEREALRKERDLVTAELMHRVRNTMSLVQAVANQTGRVSTTIDEFLGGFSGRLMAMSRNFTALSESNWQGLDIEHILKTELSPYLASDSGRITISGATLQLNVKATKDASMIFHELVTNASKYGFLSVPDGSLAVTWYLVDDMLNVTWEETGLTGLNPPNKTGFGFKMLDMFPNLQIERRFAEDGMKLSASVKVERVLGQISFKTTMS